MKKNESSFVKVYKRIILTFILSSVGAILLVGTALNFIIEKTTLDNWKKRQEFVTAEFAPQCNFEIEEAQRTLELLSKMAVFSKLPYVDQINLSLNGVPENVDLEKRRILQNLLEIQARFTSIFVLRANADLYLTQPYQNQLKARKYNFSDRPYIKEINRTKKPIISNSFIGASNIPVVVIVVPVLDKSDDITAYIGGAFYLDNLSRLVNKDRIGIFDAGFIVDQNGHIIAHTNIELVKEEFRKNYVNHPLVINFLDKSQTNDQEIIVKDSIDPINGEIYLTSFVKLKSGWGLGLAIRKETVISEIRMDVWRITSIVSIIILIISCIGIIFSYWIGKHWVSTEKDLWKRTHDLDERVKELNCLYGISKLVESSNASLDEIFQNVINLIPPSYQYPDITCSRLIIDGSEFKTKNFNETIWKQTANIKVYGEQRGILEVCYLEEKQSIKEGPFLKEERDLIEEIVERLGKIIEREQSEERLRESEEKYRSMAEAMADSVYICSPEFKIEYMNKALIKRTGYEAVGEFCYKIINDLNEICPWCVHEKVQKGQHVEIEFTSPKDNLIYKATHAPVFHEDGSISQMTIFNDITNMKQIQNQLIRSERLTATGQLAASIAHEINSPLQAISILLDSMNEKHKQTKELTSNINLLTGAFDSIRDTVRNLSDLNRPGQAEIKKININDIIEKTVALFRNNLKKNRITTNLELSSRLPNINASPQLLSQVFLNLMNNAIEAMIGKLMIGGESTKPVREINIQSKQRKGKVIIKFSDSGPGIVQEDLNKVFDPFYTKKKLMGLGIGLSNCHEIIKDHSGTITVENSSEGGASFTIRLPIDQIKG